MAGRSIGYLFLGLLTIVPAPLRSDDMSYPDAPVPYRQKLSQIEKAEGKHFRVGNSYLSFTVTDEGYFTLGAEAASLELESIDIMDMTFGHPNGSGIDAIGSSYTTLRVDGIPYKFHSMKNRGKLTVGNRGARLTKRLGDMDICQDLSLIRNRETMVSNCFRIRYEVSNRSGSVREVDLRILLDTWSGYNDGVPFRIPAYNARHLPVGKKVVRTEMEIIPEELTYWETYECETIRPAVTCIGHLIPDEGPRPDKVVLLNWPNAVDKTYALTPRKKQPITGDSAVAVYWTGHRLDAGEKRTFELLYGIRTYDLEGINYPRVVDVDNNPFFINVTKINLEEKPRKYLLWIENLPRGVELLEPLRQPVPLKVSSEEENSSIFSLKVLPDAPAEFDLDLLLVDGNTEKRFPCHIVNNLRDAPIEVESYITEGNRILTRFYDVKRIMAPGYYLVAQLHDREDRLVEKMILYDDGEHHDRKEGDSIYANTFREKLARGEYNVRVNLVKYEE